MSTGWKSLREPFRLPIGVRTASTMTASRISGMGGTPSSAFVHHPCIYLPLGNKRFPDCMPGVQGRQSPAVALQGSSELSSRRASAEAIGGAASILSTTSALLVLALLL